MMTDESSGFSRREFLRRGGIALAGAALAYTVPGIIAHASSEKGGVQMDDQGHLD